MEDENFRYFIWFIDFERFICYVILLNRIFVFGLVYVFGVGIGFMIIEFFIVVILVVWFFFYFFRFYGGVRGYLRWKLKELF